jgi:WD40 repeat protein
MKVFRIKIRWLVLAAMAASLGGMVAWYWPPAPLWRHPAPFYTMILGFGPDGQTLYSSSEMEPRTGDSWFVPITKWDAATGQCAGKVELVCAADRAVVGAHAHLAPDAATVFVIYYHNANLRGSPGYRPWSCYLYDAVTGKQRGGRIPDITNPSDYVFSPDGRWLSLPHRNPRGNQDGLVVLSTATGEPILKMRESDDDFCRFTSDGSAVATRCKKYDEGSDRPSAEFVRFFELPSGRERRTLQLPRLQGLEYGWGELIRFEDDRLEVEADEPGDRAEYRVRRQYSFDIRQGHDGQPPPGPAIAFPVGSDEVSEWWDGSGWVAQRHFVQRQKQPWQEWLDWAASKVGVNLDRYRGSGGIRFFDPQTGQALRELPIYPNSRDCVSLDGKRVALSSDLEQIEVWDTEQPPRWPWAILAATLAGGAVLLLGWRRSRRAVPTPEGKSLAVPA